MAKIPDHVIDRVRDTTDILDVVQRYVNLKKAGKYYKGLCPFHQEKTPSFTVSPEKQIFHCFGCGAGGNVFTFLMQYEKISFTDAVRRLAKEAGIEIPTSPEYKKTESENEKLFRANQVAHDFFVANMRQLPKAVQEYLEQRKITSDVCKQFSLGYAVDSWDSLVKYLRRNNYPLEPYKKLGLIAESEREKRVYDRFRNRLIFPIHNLSGKIVGFGARALSEDEKSPKYLNSPESPIYQKGRVLYGLHIAKDFIREAGYAVIVEGYVDFLQLYKNGIRNVVATSGTALTEAHARLLSRFTKKAILCYDSDEAGVKAAIRGGEILFLENMEIEVLLLPQGEDPDSFVAARGKEAFLELLEKAQDYFNFRLSALLQRYRLDNANERSAAIMEILDVISQFKDTIRMGFYVEQLAESWHVPNTLLWNQLNSILRNKRRRKESLSARDESPAAPPVEMSPVLTFKGAWSAERDLLVLLVRHFEKVSEFVLNYIDASDFINPEFKFIFEILEQEENKNKGSDALLHLVINRIQNESIRKMITENMLNEINKPARYLKDCIRKIKIARYKAEIETIQQKMKNCTSGDSEYQENLNMLQHYLNELRKWQVFDPDR